MTIHWKDFEQYFTALWCCVFFVCFVSFENLTILDLAPSGLGLIRKFVMMSDNVLII